ncbi:MAG: glycosyltransferase, partial [Acidimicrobiales bacterium]
MPPVPVIVDATALTSVARGSGIGTYTRGLLEALGRREDLSVTALATTSAPIPPGISPRIVRRMARRPRAEVLEHAVLISADVALARRGGGGVFHNLGFHAPWGVPTPWVQSLHDVIPLVLDDPDVQMLRARWKRFGPRYQGASAVIAVSEFSAQEGVKVLGLDPARVHVVHHGVNPACHPGTDWPADPPYLLVVGEYARRKGFDRAIAVIDALADAGYPHTLKVAGTVHDWGEDELHGLAASARHPDRVAILGHVNDLVALYQGAHAFLS